MPIEWDEKKNILWRCKLPGPGSSSPVIFGNRVFITSFSGVKEGSQDTSKLVRHVLCIDKKNGTVIFDNNGKKLETQIINGNCKLQWKVDWAMRWFTFDVDFEMYGKDLTESAILSNKICKVLGKKPPNGFAYELFLDEKGEKISKSKGNGITIDQWLRYASPQSLSLYMYQNPTRAKKLYSDVVPKAVDEYLSLIETFPKQEIKDQILNPVWHVHNGKPPNEKVVMTFSMLLNLVFYEVE